jgi:hypothetical protein
LVRYEEEPIFERAKEIRDIDNYNNILEGKLSKTVKWIMKKKKWDLLKLTKEKRKRQLELVGHSGPYYHFLVCPACSFIGDKQASKVRCSNSRVL